MRRRVPNVQLRLLLAEAGWTGEALVRTVNELGVEAGLTLGYQRSSVTQWLSGVRPRSPVPELVAEGLSRALGRRVTVGDTGLGRTGETDLSAWWGDAVERLADAGRRALLKGTTYTVAALAVPTWAAVSSSRLGGAGQAAGDGTPVGRAEAESAAAMIRVFSDSDTALGGGYARQALAGYLSTTIAPWLRADTAPAVHRELLTTAARLSYLCGFMCFDDELHGSAQQYYLTSLRLAAEGGDGYGYAIALRALSVQAHHLGHHPQALDLAESSVRTASAAPAHSRAFLLGQLAVAQAAVGNRRDAMATLAAADRHLARSSNSSPAVGAYHPASLAHQHAATAVSLGDRATAIRALASSLRCRPPHERRSRAITLAQLAELQIAEGRLERACSTWQDFLDDYPLLSSRRADRAMASLRAHARAHQRNPVARALLERARSLVTASRR
ncbi:hypothetical protein Lesp02_22850 [Lentzea sp. NBRC 105346]|nr:hypothetical protein Lesp02_22850 [Lentzea sp. NBRC 105346]